MRILFKCLVHIEMCLSRPVVTYEEPDMKQLQDSTRLFELTTIMDCTCPSTCMMDSMCLLDDYASVDVHAHDSTFKSKMDIMFLQQGDMKKSQTSWFLKQAHMKEDQRWLVG